jgi:hypothetical protein
MVDVVRRGHPGRPGSGKASPYLSRGLPMREKNPNPGGCLIYT